MIDIVERLRKPCVEWRCDYRDQMCKEAAIEIKRLRAIQSAAQRVCWFDWSGSDDDACATINALRAALAAREE